MISFTFLAVATFVLTILMNIIRKNSTVVTIFQIASIFAAFALISLGVAENTYGLIVAGILSLVVKAFIAPTFLQDLIKKYDGYFSAPSYLSVPLTLVVLAILTAFSRFVIFTSVPTVENTTVAALFLASIFGMFFFMINRRGTLSQIVGILGMENNIVLITVFLGIEHSIALELAVSFDILVWVAIAITFLTLIYRQFGSMETSMTHLKEE